MSGAEPGIDKSAKTKKNGPTEVEPLATWCAKVFTRKASSSAANCRGRLSRFPAGALRRVRERYFRRLRRCCRCRRSASYRQAAFDLDSWKIHPDRQLRLRKRDP